MRRAAAYLVIGAATAAAIFARLLLNPLLGDRLPFITLFGAVALAVWIGGTFPAVLAAVAGYAFIERFVLRQDPTGSLSPASPAGTVALLAYAFTCLLMIALGSGTRRARRRAEEAAQEVGNQKRRLEYEVAEHRRTGEALRRSEADLELIAERTPVALTRCSRDRRFVFVNRAAAEFLGRPPEEIVGRPIVEVVGEAGMAAIAPHIERVLTGEQVEFEADIPYAHGGKRSMHVVYTPDLDEMGEVAGWFASVQDISTRKEAEAAVVERERLFRTLVESTSQTAWQCRPGGDPIRQIGEETAAWWRAFTGQTEAERTARDGTGWLDAVHPDDRETARQNWMEIRAVAGPTSAAYRVRRARDGAWRWLQVRGVPIVGPGGAVIEIAGTIADVTEKREAEQARQRSEETLREGDRRKDEFLATLAHELRNPLAPVRNAVEVLRLKGSPTPEVQWAREVIDRQMRQMARLIDDLLDVSRITRDVLELRRERVDLGTVLHAAIETSEGLIETAGHELEVVLPPHPVFLQGDVTRLAQVFSNLLSNAAKFSHPGSRITLTAGRQGDQVVVAVKDTGIGIPKEMQPHIFEMFVQVDRSIERSQGGLGIGLTLVKRLLELHGGSIEVKSDGVGRGSEFIARLPIAPADAAESPAPRPLADLRQPARGRVLVADDNQDAAASLSTLLDLLGYETCTATDGAAALTAAEEFRPAVALLDIGMPKTSGYDVARHIRRQAWGKDVVLMAVTGWGQQEDRKRTLEAGFDHHLVKPVDPDLLTHLLASLSPRRREA